MLFAERNVGEIMALIINHTQQNQKNAKLPFFEGALTYYLH
jgi:hypothetical protein